MSLLESPKYYDYTHIAALSFPEQVFEQFYDNYLRWRDGFSLINSIDFTKGY